ncbi:uncharacterized protein LOC129585427 [Paramacrobiotus metropolitanus]|uniref:uncharacterized protein LOC129585427 n=1 Tax=Paramacrobiotus metropolitanus TaxID=2943436 RepID=UPI0024465BD7|nr:uncharacterized protein LOC129585427 [Paramacrobiotus metropolitanus]
MIISYYQQALDEENDRISHHTTLSDTALEFVTVKQGGNQLINCGNDKVIYIHSANYTQGDTCFYNVHVAVDGLCGRKHSCDLNPAAYGQSTFFTYDYYYGVKCPGNDKQLNVQYSCEAIPKEGQEFFMVTPANEEMTLTCNNNQRLFIRRAYYGYGDLFDDATVTVRGICSGQPGYKCTYKPWIPEFSDFDGNWDFAVVYYYCSNELNTPGQLDYLYVEGGQEVNLSCLEGRILDIDFAYYGAGGYQADVGVVVKSKCQNHHNCNFWANNDLFLNPIGGSKHLTIGYQCRARRWNDLQYITIDHDYLGTIDCHGQFINIVEAFYGGGYIQEDVTANRYFDRCETDFPEPFRNTYCVLGARDLYFGTVGGGRLTVGYFCSTHQHNDYRRRYRRFLYGTGENRDSTYPYQEGMYFPGGYFNEQGFNNFGFTGVQQ